MSADGTITLVARAEASNGSLFGVLSGKTLIPCWRVRFTLDDPHALPDVGKAQPAHDWCVDLPRKDDMVPAQSGDRIEVSTLGKRDVRISRAGMPDVLVRALAPGCYDAAKVA